MNPDQFLEFYGSQRVSAILRTDNRQKARSAMLAAVDGGMKVIEFTLTVPGALDLIREFSQRNGLVVGAGTVLSTDDAQAAADAGANFLVSPVLDMEVIEKAHALNIPIMPGCSTPTEMLQAHRAGAQLQKLFPAQGTGPLWVKQILGPLPFLRVVPTSGVELDNFEAYLQAGAFALGFVNSLFVPDDVAAQRWDAIRDRAGHIVRRIEALAE